MAKEALDELIDTTHEITEPTVVELSLIQSNINNIARITDDPVIDVVPLAENVVSVERYREGRGLLALEDAKKTMWERIKKWFAGFIAWIKDKAKAILGYFTNTKKEAEDLKEQVKAKDSSGKVTIEKPQVVVIKNSKTGKTIKEKVAELSEKYKNMDSAGVAAARKLYEEAERASGVITAADIQARFDAMEKTVDEIRKSMHEALGDIGTDVSFKSPGTTSANEDHPEMPGVEVTYEESDTPITVNGIEVCEIIIESVKKQEEMAKILEKTSEKINELLKKAEAKFEGKEADMVASIIRSLSANVSTLAVKVPSKLVMMQKRQLKEIRRGLAAA